MRSCYTRLAMTATACLVAVLSLSCTGSAVQYQAVLAEADAGAIIPIGDQGVLVVVNLGEQLAVSCVFIRDASSVTSASWGSNRVPESNPIGPGEQRDFALIQGLYDIAIIRPSLDPEAAGGDETYINQQFFVSENTVHTVTVNDFTDFQDVAPHCGAGE